MKLKTFSKYEILRFYFYSPIQFKYLKLFESILSILIPRAKKRAWFLNLLNKLNKKPDLNSCFISPPAEQTSSKR